MVLHLSARNANLPDVQVCGKKLKLMIIN